MKKLLSFILCLIMVVGVVSPAALMAAEDPEGSAVEEMIIEEPVFAEEPAAATGEDLPEEIVPEVILPEEAAVLPEETEEAGVPETDAGAVIEETAGEQETGFIPETGPEEEVQITEEDPDGPDTQEVLPEELPGEERAFPVSVIKSDNGQIAFVEREGLPQAEPAESEEVLEMRRFAPGTLVEIRALADEGYVLEEIRVLPEEPRPEGQGEYPLTGTEEGYAFPMPEEAVRVTARFAEEKIPEEDGKEAEEAEAEEELESAGSTSDTKVTGVKLDRTGQKVAVGKSFTLKAAVSPAGAANKKVTWKSSNTAVATVSSTGVVTGKKAGTATITVKTADGGKTAACKVTVVKPVTGVKLDKTKATMGSGESLVLKATVSPSDATDKKVTWKSSNTKIATVSSTGKVTAGASADGTAKITATTADGKKTATCTVTVRKPTVSYQTHVQNVGWQSYVKNGAMAGTQGKSLRLEGIRIRLGNRPYSGGISYRTHIQNIGWESSWKSDDAMSGTSGRSLRLEAIQIKLTGEMAKHYDVYYRVHAQNIGWMGWAMNGASAGTAGYSYRLEGIQVVLVTKGGSEPSKNLGGNTQATEAPFRDRDWGTRTVTVTFNANGGKYYQQWMDSESAVGTTITAKCKNGDLIMSKVISPNQISSKSANDSNIYRKGYAFNGWFLDKECRNPLRSSTRAEKNMTLYAGWTKNYYTVTLNPGDGQYYNVWSEKNNMTGSLTIYVRKNCTLRSASKYLPLSWYRGDRVTNTYTFTKGGNDVVSMDTVIKRNMVIYARYS